MSEKIFTVTDIKSHNSYRLTISYNSFTVEFIVQNPTYTREKYESGNISLAAFQQKNKLFKQFDNTLKIADVLRSKIEKKQFSLELPSLIFKFHNEYDNLENVKFDLKASSGNQSNQSGKGDTAKARIENLDKLTSGTSKTSSYKPTQAESFKPKKPNPPPVSQQPPKPVNVASQPKVSSNPPPSSSSNPSSISTIPIVGKYIPPSRDTNGTIFQRIEKCKKLKTDMKKTLEDINNRLLDVKKRIDNFVDKAFANIPSADDKKKSSFSYY